MKKNSIIISILITSILTFTTFAQGSSKDDLSDPKESKAKGNKTKVKVKWDIKDFADLEGEDVEAKVEWVIEKFAIPLENDFDLEPLKTRKGRGKDDEDDFEEASALWEELVAERKPMVRAIELMFLDIPGNKVADTSFKYRGFKDFHEGLTWTSIYIKLSGPRNKHLKIIDKLKESFEMHKELKPKKLIKQNKRLEKEYSKAMKALSKLKKKNKDNTYLSGQSDEEFPEMISEGLDALKQIFKSRTTFIEELKKQLKKAKAWKAPKKKKEEVEEEETEEKTNVSDDEEK